jgi:glycosyltransferase involved in cell wall biosynthesis
MDMFAGPIQSNPSPDPAEILAEADALRDARQWTAAATAYGAFLRLAPEEWPIRVQYGHCLKESGNPHAALVSYREADRQHPDDADIQLQIGHALKLLDRPEEAFEHYARALTLDPGNAAARDEVLAFETPPQASAPASPLVSAPAPPARPSPAGPAALVFDASDLLDYFRHNRAPTGIQRVQLNVIREALAAEAGGVVVGCFDGSAGAWKAVPQPLFLRLARLSREGTAVADPAWQAAVGAVRDALQAGPPIAFAPGSCLVNLGTSWWIPDYLRMVRDAKARHGLRYIPFIHDCIPLIVPEHCAAELVDEFARWFAAVCLHADAVLVNSECTRADFIAAQRRLLPGLDIPCFQMPLDAADPPGTATTPPALRSGRPYVLFVGTIESRKNHLLAFNAWLTLLRRHGPEAVPDLVCVGKQGWLADAALRLHANSAALRGRVHLLHGVPDTELEALYRGCLFTLYNSFYEGWGLPVTESLAHGKVALVPEHSSLPEAGRHGAVFFAPQSEPDLVAKLEQLMFDAGFRTAREAEVAAGPRPRRWADLAAQVQAHVEASHRTSLPAPRDRLAFRLGEVHPLRLLPGPDPSLAMAVADVLREGPGWSRLETWGVWTTLGQSLLRLPVEAGRLRAYLELVAPPQAVRFGIRAGMRGSPPGGFREVEAAGREVLFCTLDVTAEAGGELQIEIETGQGVVLPGDQRQVGIGVRSVMVCRRDDLAARLDYLERAALPRLVSA